MDQAASSQVSPKRPSDRDLIAAARAAARPVSDSTTRGRTDELPSADAFSGYQVLKEIHRGGQGVVYQAIQLATKRKVAIKVLHHGPFASASDRKRIEREVEILAQLDHPNIVAVLDSGESQGSFYYVMDYISGKPLDEYVQRTNLAQKQVVELMAKIADAVNAAHLRGVIHRDLKPSNVRVDAAGEPHVVDFGLAKIASAGSTHGRDAAPEPMTLTGQFVGSLPWASPEQAEGSPDRIDLRTDVYSLGVVMFQMLTGGFPYEVAGNMRQVLDNICRAEPRRPSTVRAKISDEVETIVLKCLSKEPERRYQTAGELARDLKRYLAGEPIEAKRDSGWYVLRKTVRQYKLPAAVAATALVGLIVTAVVASVMWGRESRAKNDARLATVRAEAAKSEAETALGRAVDAERIAEERAEHAEQVKLLLKRIITASDPEKAGAGDPPVSQVLEQAAAELKRRNLPPLVEAEARAFVGQTFLDIGKTREAERELRESVRLYERAGASATRDATGARLSLADALKVLQASAEAERLYLQVIAEREYAGGPDDSMRMTARTNLANMWAATGKAQDAVPILRESMDYYRTQEGLSSREAFKATILYGEALMRANRAPEGVTIIEQALQEAGGDWPSPDITLARARKRLGDVLIALKRFEEAETHLGLALADFRQILDPTSTELAVAIMAYAISIHEQKDDYPRSEALVREAIDIARAQPGFDGVTLFKYRLTLGTSLMRQGRFDESERELLDIHAGLSARPELPASLMQICRTRLAELYGEEKLNRPDEAAKYRDPPVAPPPAPSGGG